MSNIDALKPMTVQQLIDKLSAIEDKTLPILLIDTEGSYDFSSMEPVVKDIWLCRHPVTKNIFIRDEDVSWSWDHLHGPWVNELHKVCCL